MEWIVHMCMCPFRSGQDWVSAEPREPGNLPEGLWPDRTLLWRGGGGCQPGSAGGPKSRPVPLPAAGRTHGGFSALTSPVFFLVCKCLAETVAVAGLWPVLGSHLMFAGPDPPPTTCSVQGWTGKTRDGTCEHIWLICCLTLWELVKSPCLCHGKPRLKKEFRFFFCFFCCCSLMIRHDIPLTSCDIIFVILNDVSDICVAVRNLTLVSLFQCETTSLVFRKKSSKWTDGATSFFFFFFSYHSWNAIINEIMSGQIWSVVADVLKISRQLVDLHILPWPCVRSEAAAHAFWAPLLSGGNFIVYLFVLWELWRGSSLHWIKGTASWIMKLAHRRRIVCFAAYFKCSLRNRFQGKQVLSTLKDLAY